MSFPYFTYLLTNKRHTVLYTGVTNDPRTRFWEHMQVNGFVKKYNLTKVVYYEGFDSITHAIRREKYIKGKNRLWKVSLISTFNPGWLDLSLDLDLMRNVVSR